MWLPTVLALLAPISAARPGGQEPENGKAHAVEVPRQFDNETLLRSWRRDGIGGSAPHAARPVPPPPIRPESYLVLETDGPRDQAWHAFVCKYLLSDNDPIPTDGAIGPLQESKWHRASVPATGELRGACRFAFTTIHAQERGVWMARMPGASALFLNGEGFVGDPERRGFLGVPVELQEGDNRVFVVGIESGFELEFWKPATRIVIGTWDPEFKALERGHTNSLSEDLVVPLFNASTEPAHSIHYHYGHAQCDDGHGVPRLSDWRDGGTLAPLGMEKHGSSLFGFREGDAGEECNRFLIPLCAQDETDKDADRRVIQLALGDAPIRRPPPPHWPDAKPDKCVLLVYGTIGKQEDQSTNLAVARYYQQRLWYWSRMWPMLITDEQFLHPSRVGIDDWEGTAFVFGNPETNAVLAKSRSSPEVLPEKAESILDVTAPPGSSPRQGHERFGTFSATDARTMRLLYAIDPFTDLRADDKKAAFGVDGTKMKILRLR